VCSSDLLRRSLADETVLERSVAAVLQAPFPEVTADTPVADVLHRLKEEKVLLVRDAATGTPVGILTRHDLVGFLSEQGGTHAV
jgi:cystathionine beta-synthase